MALHHTDHFIRRFIVVVGLLLLINTIYFATPDFRLSGEVAVTAPESSAEIKKTKWDMALRHPIFGAYNFAVQLDSSGAIKFSSDHILIGDITLKPNYRLEDNGVSLLNRGFGLLDFDIDYNLDGVQDAGFLISTRQFTPGSEIDITLQQDNSGELSYASFSGENISKGSTVFMFTREGDNVTTYKMWSGDVGVPGSDEKVFTVCVKVNGSQKCATAGSSGKAEVCHHLAAMLRAANENNDRGSGRDERGAAERIEDAMSGLKCGYQGPSGIIPPKFPDRLEKDK